MVRERGLEPLSPYGRQILSLLRIPIPSLSLRFGGPVTDMIGEVDKAASIGGEILPLNRLPREWRSDEFRLRRLNSDRLLSRENFFGRATAR